MVYDGLHTQAHATASRQLPRFPCSSFCGAPCINVICPASRPLQLSPSVSSINHQLEVVADSSAAAVAELAAKVEGLQGDIGQIKELLLALLAKQQ